MGFAAKTRRKSVLDTIGNASCYGLMLLATRKRFGISHDSTYRGGGAGTGPMLLVLGVPPPITTSLVSGGVSHS